MTCPNCGTQMQANAVFCGRCGARMAAAPEAHAVPTYAASAAPAPQAPAGPVKKKEFLRKHADGKTKTAAFVALFTMLISIVVLMLGAYSCLNTDLREIPVLNRMDIDDVFEDFEDIDEDELEAEFDAAERVMSRSEWRKVKKLKKSVNDILDTFSINNCFAFINILEEVDDEGIFDDYDVNLNQYIGNYEEEFEMLQEAYGFMIVAVNMLFVLPALFALLGGLKKSVVWSVLALVFSILPQLALNGVLWLVANAVVLIVQIVLCSMVQKRYRAYRKGVTLR